MATKRSVFFINVHETTVIQKLYTIECDDQFKAQEIAMQGKIKPAAEGQISKTVNINQWVELPPDAAGIEIHLKEVKNATPG